MGEDALQIPFICIDDRDSSPPYNFNLSFPQLPSGVPLRRFGGKGGGGGARRARAPWVGQHAH